MNPLFEVLFFLLPLAGVMFSSTELVVAKEWLGILLILNASYYTTPALENWLPDTHVPADLHLSACACAE